MSVQQTPETITSRTVTVNGLNIHYRESGVPDKDRTVTLLLHGWPTSSYLWRNVMPELGTKGWTIAPDLPGYGRSDKPTDAVFSYNYWDKFITAFLKKINARQVKLVVHDLGGPIGLIWAVRHPEQIKHLVLLNTLVYADLNWSAKLFVLLTKVPGLNRLLIRPAPLRAIMNLGVSNKLDNATKQAYSEPYYDPDARHCLLTSVHHLNPVAAREVEKNLTKINAPVTCIYGENDRLLLDIADTMMKVKQDLPQASITRIPNCGHFLQEDHPQLLSSTLVKRFAEA